MTPPSFSAFILDMDGVIYKGDQILAGASELLSYFDSRKHPYLFVTNNSTRTPLQVARHLERMGIAVNPDRILTSSIGVALFLKKSHPHGGRVFVLGEEGLRTPLGEAGFTIVDQPPQLNYPPDTVSPSGFTDGDQNHDRARVVSHRCPKAPTYSEHAKP